MEKKSLIQLKNSGIPSMLQNIEECLALNKQNSILAIARKEQNLLEIKEILEKILEIL